jgi:dUTP pyrophosphatase
MEIEVKLLHPAARPPARAHPGDAGADLCSVEEMSIPPGERRDVGTGLALAIPAGYAGFVQPRSGLAFKHGIMVVNSPGLIDAGYRGEVRVSLYSGGAHSPIGRPKGRRAGFRREPPVGGHSARTRRVW